MSIEQRVDRTVVDAVHPVSEQRARMQRRALEPVIHNGWFEVGCEPMSEPEKAAAPKPATTRPRRGKKEKS